MNPRIPGVDMDCLGVGASRSNVADSNVDKVNPVVRAFRHLRDRAVRARERRVAIAELSRLDDRQLRDIGVRRDRIEKLVDEHLRRSADSDGPRE